MKMQRYRFSRRFPRPLIVINGPAKSTADLLNARSDVLSIEVGRGAIICEQGLDFHHLHSAHSFSHSRITSRAEGIHYLDKSAARV